MRSSSRPGGKWPLHIGGNGATAFEGQLAEVRIWQEARPQSDLLWNMFVRMNTLNLPDRLGGYWQFATAETVGEDNSGRSGDAVIVGMVDWFMEGPVLAGKASLRPSPLIKTSEYSRKSCDSLCPAWSSNCGWATRSPSAVSQGVCSASKFNGACPSSMNFSNAEILCQK